MQLGCRYRGKLLYGLLFFALFQVFLFIAQTLNPFISLQKHQLSQVDNHVTPPGHVAQSGHVTRLSSSPASSARYTTPSSGTKNAYEMPYEAFTGPNVIRELNLSEASVLDQARAFLRLIPDHRSIKFLKSAFLNNRDIVPYLDLVSKRPNRRQLGAMNCENGHCLINGRTIKKKVVEENPADMFRFLPPKDKLLKEFRNPCWSAPDGFKQETLFCIPEFFIIGFTKSGTTDLYSMLLNHTLISVRDRKEPHFFDRSRRGRSTRMHREITDYPQSFASFVSRGHFRENLVLTYKEVEGTDVLFHGITVDATPSNVWDNEFWEKLHPGYQEPPVTNADTISAVHPGAKLIFLMRDPIDRMKSAYQFFCKAGVYACNLPVTPEKFHDLVAEAVGSFKRCLKTNNIRGCTYSTKTHQLATHLYASIYHIYIQDYMRVFPRNQLYFLRFEDYIEDQIGSVNAICEFLGVPKFPEQTLRDYLAENQPRNQKDKRFSIPYVKNETVVMLEDFFKPYLRELVNLLGDEKWHWNRPY